MSDLEKQRCGGALAGKTARSCDGCARCRARWYCAADDAFLCQTCDSSVHSANPLARRHRRLRLKYSWCSSGAAALDGNEEEDEENFDGPSWLRGFKRKARTPRKGKKGMAPRPPELAETSPSVEEEQLLYCVPGFDPATAEFRSASSGNEDTKPPVESDGSTPSSTTTVDAADRMAEYMPSDVEIAEFAANMESLLGEASGDDAAFSMERLGLLDNANYFTKELKAEPADEAEQNYPVSDELDKDMTRDSLELDFNCPGSSSTAEEEDELDVEKTEDQHDEPKTARLRLDYEAVISAWSANGSSPWTDGERPQINLANCWNDCMGGGWGEGRGGAGGGVAQVAVDVGRQARVSRYREKRRTRLFAKKIRYEVRKLNAERRPRMKGRFVKRAPGSAAAAFLPALIPTTVRAPLRHRLRNGRHRVLSTSKLLGRRVPGPPASATATTIPKTASRPASAPASRSAKSPRSSIKDPVRAGRMGRCTR
ncbi:zinc finger protein CONSTANS-LIKE 16-like [Zingiber officinale]|uniref:zinc finger protein CONSTANS-LIKE 16-like n=1 Tax=Zingiber officinale TaxID=94328 RepID=UPI001C4B0804|nr:zinc finger protein CONSTANS-LIKE 16-like [Zingiber officinale]